MTNITLSSITFVDFEEPNDELCELLYICLLDSISMYTSLYNINQLNSMDKISDIDILTVAVDAIHHYTDAFLLTISDLYPTALAVEYMISHDGSSFVFSPGNIFTGKISHKMDKLQIDPVIKFYMYQY